MVATTLISLIPYRRARRAVIPLFVLMVPLLAAGPVTAFDHPRWYNADKLAQAAQRISALGMSNNDVSSFGIGYSGETVTNQLTGADIDKACARSDPAIYRAIYRDDALDISVFFGFSELTRSDIVVDPYNARAFLHQLQRPCQDGLRACGFSWVGHPVSADAPFVLTRLITGPDGPVRARIRLYDSAVDDDLNLILDKAIERQKRKSMLVQGHFLDALSTEDVVLYQGHSRLGTGPGFGTFQALSPQWWRAMLLSPEREAMAEVLAGRQQSLPLLGLFACNSRGHYYDMLRRATPDTALVLSDDITYVDEDSVRLFATLNAVLGQQCESALNTALDLPNGKAEYHLPGWFEPAPPVQVSEQNLDPDLAWGMN